MRKKCCLMLLAMGLLLGGLAHAQSGYDEAVRAFETGNLVQAEASLKPLLEQEPYHPAYNHLMGKIKLKAEDWNAARMYLLTAWSGDANLPGLKHDIAFMKYKTEDYASAITLFKDLTQADPSDISVRYYLAVCYQKTGQEGRAIPEFEYVRDRAESGELRQNATAWLKKLGTEEQAPTRPKLKAYAMYLKAGYQYDDNIHMEPLDLDIYNDDDDYCVEVFLSGSYHLINRERFIAGIGYSHYETMHQDLKEYDIRASMGHVFMEYRTAALRMGLRYLPAYYWLDGESYLLRHQINPRLAWNITSQLIAELAYSYYDNHYFEDEGREGETHEPAFNLYLNSAKKAVMFHAGASYEDTSAENPSEAYTRWRVRAGVSVDLFWRLNASLAGSYSRKCHDQPAADGQEEREDDRFTASVALSRPLFVNWLGIRGEYDYTRNDSNRDIYEYEINTVAVFLTLNF